MVAERYTPTPGLNPGLRTPDYAIPDSALGPRTPDSTIPDSALGSRTPDYAIPDSAKRPRTPDYKSPDSGNANPMLIPTSNTVSN